MIGPACNQLAMGQMGMGPLLRTWKLKFFDPTLFFFQIPNFGLSENHATQTLILKLILIFPIKASEKHFLVSSILPLWPPKKSISSWPACERLPGCRRSCSHWTGPARRRDSAAHAAPGDREGHRGHRWHGEAPRRATEAAAPRPKSGQGLSWVTDIRKNLGHNGVKIPSVPGCSDAWAVGAQEASSEVLYDLGDLLDGHV